MACKCPVIAVGSKGFFGTVTPNNYNMAWEAWFGDHQAREKWTEALFIQHIKQVFEMNDDEQSQNAWLGRKFIKEKFPLSSVTDDLLTVYHTIKPQQIRYVQG